MKKTITVKELRARLLNELNALSDHDEVTFGGGRLSLYRTRDHGDGHGKKLINIEFNEVYEVTLDPDKL